MVKILFKICLIILLFINPIKTYSAEILQIRNTKNILIGDQNRNLSIKLFCSNVEKFNESVALDLLQKNFPRGTKVRIKPIGLKDDQIEAKVFRLNSGIEMSDLLSSNDLSKDNC